MINKRNNIISVVASRVRIKNMKYGMKITTSITEAYDINNFKSQHIMERHYQVRSNFHPICLGLDQGGLKITVIGITGLGGFTIAFGFYLDSTRQVYIHRLRFPDK